MQIDARVAALLPVARAHRRALHRIPEESNHESLTQQYLMEALRALSPDALDTYAGTGLRAVFYGSDKSRAMRTVGFRSDIDALCIQEKNDIDFASQRPGFMHACGHDGHMAALLSLARLVSENRKQLACNVALLFQPAEELDGGAARMVQGGALKNPDIDEIFGMHLLPDLPMGRLGCCEGPLMASTSELNIDIEGKSAHGAMPHKGLDAIAAAAHLYTLLQTSITRCLDPYERALLTVGKLVAGERRNIVAANAHLECTARTFSEHVYGKLRQHIIGDMAGIEVAFGVKVSLSELVYYPPVVNPPELAQRVMRECGDALVVMRPLMIAEDFSFYQREIPGVFSFCGCGSELYDRPLHSDCFNFDEAALLPGIQLFTRLIHWRKE